MNQIKRAPVRSSVSAASILVSAVALTGCLGSVGEGQSWEKGPSPVDGGSQQEWTRCASRWGFCDFDGTRQVRYGRRNDFVVRTFTDGVWCEADIFGSDRRGRAYCEVGPVQGETEGSVAQAPTVEPAVDEPTADPVVEEPATAPAPEETTADTTTADTGSVMDHDAVPDGDHDGNHPRVNADAIPEGSPGTDEVRVRYTSEVPAPSDGTGNFRTVCEFSHMAFDDPIVFPGEPGRSHLHAFFGNTGADAHSTTESLMTTGNSTCRGGIINRSAYWVPATIDADGNPVAPRDVGAYYKTGYNGVAPEEVQSFPEGLRIIAGGNPNDPSSLPSSHIFYGCEGEPYNPQTTIPDCAPGDVVIMSIQFPQCWDGVNLDSPDHRSHMAYPAGGCPPSHPVAIPEITFNVHYEVGPEGTDGWRLASDDLSMPPGTSLHADWFAAWDPDIVDEFVQNCDNAAVDCHSQLLGPNRGIY